MFKYLTIWTNRYCHLKLEMAFFFILTKIKKQLWEFYVWLSFSFILIYEIHSHQFAKITTPALMTLSANWVRGFNTNLCKLLLCFINLIEHSFVQKRYTIKIQVIYENWIAIPKRIFVLCILEIQLVMQWFFLINYCILIWQRVAIALRCIWIYW